jgi:hypothetical protein
MSDVLDILPGPAGLFRFTDNLSTAGWQQDREARARLERWCASCGQSACYGFGVSLKDDGTWTCADASCVASAEAEIAQRCGGASACDVTASGAAVPQMPSAPLAKPIDETAAPVLDLFGAAA